MYIISLLYVYVVSSILHRTHNLNQNWLFWKEGRNVLFNDALSTFYLRLYGVRHLVKNHSDSERGNPLPPHGQTGYHIPRPLFTTRGALAWTKNRPDDTSHHERTLLPRSYISLHFGRSVHDQLDSTMSVHPFQGTF